MLALVARGLTNPEIAAELSSARPVKTHVTASSPSSASATELQAVVFAYEYGIVDPGAVD